MKAFQYATARSTDSARELAGEGVDGITTTCDALWMGVPVLSLAGKTPPGRAGLSILSAVGLPELVAGDPDDLVRRAAELAGDLPRLAELRATLRRRVLASPLADAARFTADMEAAYRQMWRTWCAAGPATEGGERCGSGDRRV